MPRRVNRLLLVAGLRRGLLGGSRPWIVVLGAAAAFRLLGRMTTKEPKVVYCEELGQGEQLVISHLPSVGPPPARDAKMEE